MYAMTAIPHQRVSLFVADLIIFASLIRTEVPACRHLLLRATLDFLQIPRHRRFALRRLLFPLIFQAESAVTLVFRAQDGCFSWPFGFLLLRKQVAQCSVDFNQENEKREQYQQVIEQGRG